MLKIDGKTGPYGHATDAATWGRNCFRNRHDALKAATAAFQTDPNQLAALFTQTVDVFAPTPKAAHKRAGALGFAQEAIDTLDTNGSNSIDTPEEMEAYRGLDGLSDRDFLKYMFLLNGEVTNRVIAPLVEKAMGETLQMAPEIEELDTYATQLLVTKVQAGQRLEMIAGDLKDGDVDENGELTANELAAEVLLHPHFSPAAGEVFPRGFATEESGFVASINQRYFEWDTEFNGQKPRNEIHPVHRVVTTAMQMVTLADNKNAKTEMLAAVMKHYNLLDKQVPNTTQAQEGMGSQSVH